MRKGWILTTAVLLPLVCAATTAVAGVGLGANFSLPSGDFDKLYNTGYGFNGIVHYPVTPLATLTGDIGWTQFSTKDFTTALGDLTGLDLGGADLSMWNFTGGAKVNLMPLGLGLEYGYFTEIDEWGLVPYVSFGFSKLDLSFRYKATGDANWFKVRLGVMF